MVDTIRIQSPLIPMQLLDYYQKRLIFRQAYNLETQQQIYTFISGNLLGSWDSNISINVDLMAFEYDEEQKRPIKILNSEYFTLTIELSLHKFIEGHNIFNGFDDIIEPIKKLFLTIEGYFNVDLPPAEEWLIRRIDIGYNFYMEPEQKLEFFTSYSKINYPRRQRRTYQGNGIYFSGTTTTLKFYDKGIEFRKHDLPRLKKLFPKSKYGYLAAIRAHADCLIRCEVEVHYKKLKSIGIEKIIDYKPEILIELYNKEVEKVMKYKNEQITNDSKSVLDLLSRKYNERIARTVYSTWLLLATNEEEEIKQRMPKSTLARHKKIMKDLNITWINSDFEKLQEHLESQKEYISVIPVDFTLYSTSKYHVNKLVKIAI